MEVFVMDPHFLLDTQSSLPYYPASSFSLAPFVFSPPLSLEFFTALAHSSFQRSRFPIEGDTGLKDLLFTGFSFPNAHPLCIFSA